MLSQANPRPPVPVVFRIIHASYWIFIVIMVASYTSQLVALRTVTTRSLPINSLKELSESPLYEVFIPAGTALFDYFRFANEGPFKEIWQKKLVGKPNNYVTPNVDTMLELAPAICDSNHVLALNTEDLEYMASKIEICDVALVDERILGGYMTFAAYKGFAHIEMFNKRYVV